VNAGFETKDIEAIGGGFAFEFRQNGVGQPLPARGFAHEHAFDLGEIFEEGDAAAAERFAFAARNEEADVWPKERIERETMTLFGRIELREFGFEFFDEQADFRRRRWREANFNRRCSCFAYRRPTMSFPLCVHPYPPKVPSGWSVV
jgi:hypothetical protein